MSRENDRNKGKVGIQGSCVVGKYLWFSLAQANGLCRMNLESKEIEYISLIPNEPVAQEFLFSDIKQYGNKLIMTPMNASGIAVYDLQSNTFSRVPLSTKTIKNRTGYEKWSGFYTSIIFEKSIFMIPYMFPAIIRMNIDTHDIKYLDDFMDDILEDYRKEKIFFREDTAENKDAVYAVSLAYGGVLRICGDETKFIIKTQLSEQEGFSCIKKTEIGYMLLQPIKKRILLFDHKWNEMNHISYDVSMSTDHSLDFIGSIQIGEYIYFIPYFSSEMMRIHIFSMTVDFPAKYEEEPLYVRFWEYDHKLYCYGRYKIDIFEPDNMKRKTIHLDVGSIFWKKIIDSAAGSNEIIVEKDGMNLHNFMDVLSIH